MAGEVVGRVAVDVDEVAVAEEDEEIADDEEVEAGADGFVPANVLAVDTVEKAAAVDLAFCWRRAP